MVSSQNNRVEPQEQQKQDLFKSFYSEASSFYKEKQEQFGQDLPQHIDQMASNKLQRIRTLKEEIMKEALTFKQKYEEFQAKIASNNVMDASMDGTLNSDKSEYLSCVKFKIDEKKLEQMLDKDVDHWRRAKESAKNRVVKTQKEIEAFLQKQKKEMEQYLLDKQRQLYRFTGGISELRKLDPFEVKEGLLTTVEWPSLEQAKEFEWNGEMNLCRIIYRRGCNYANYPLGGIQLEFTNGMKSPMIQAHGDNLYREQILDVDPQRKIAKISIDCLESAKFTAIRLIDEQGSYIVDHRWYKGQSNWVTKDIPDGEQIVGLYANTSSNSDFLQKLGFITAKLY